MKFCIYTSRNEVRRVKCFDPSISQSISQFVSPVFFVSTTPLKLFNRISWNFVVMKDIMCSCAYSQEILIPFLANLSRRLKWAFLITICLLSVVIVDVINCSHFHLLLQNHWANFNQTWHQCIFGWRGFKFVQLKNYLILTKEIMGIFS